MISIANSSKYIFFLFFSNYRIVRREEDKEGETVRQGREGKKKCKGIRNINEKWKKIIHTEETREKTKRGEAERAKGKINN